MLKKARIKDFILGFVAYFVVTISLDFLGLDSIIIRISIFIFLMLVGYFIIPLHKKNKKLI